MVDDRGKVCGSIQLHRVEGVMICVNDSIDATAVRVRLVTILFNETQIKFLHVLLAYVINKCHQFKCSSILPTSDIKGISSIKFYCLSYFRLGLQKLNLSCICYDMLAHL